MRRRYRLLAVAWGIAATVGTARSAPVQDNFLMRNTGDLVALCAAPPSNPLYTAAVNFCQGFAVGVFRVLQEENSARGRGALFCMPDPAPTRTEAVAQFVAWAKQKPSRLAQPPADGIAAFLAHGYPCSPTR